MSAIKNHARDLWYSTVGRDKKLSNALVEELSDLEAVVKIAEAVIAQMPKPPEPNEEGEYGAVYLSIGAPIWKTMDDLKKAVRKVKKK